MPIVVCPKDYRVEIRECKAEDLVEIDIFKELRAILKIMQGGK